MFASSLLILFSSNSLALAFLKSAMNCTSPRMFALFPEDPRLKKPAAAEDAMMGSVFLSLVILKCGTVSHTPDNVRIKYVTANWREV